MWKRNRWRVYSINVQMNIPKAINGTISARERPILTDMEMHQRETGNQITGTTHHLVRVKNCSIASMSENEDQRLIDTMPIIKK